MWSGLSLLRSHRGLSKKQDWKWKRMMSVFGVLRPMLDERRVG